MQHNKNTENMALLYAYGELEEDKQKEFTQHLKDCAKCQAIVQTCALTTAALPEKPAPAFHLQPTRKGIMDYIAPMLNFKRLVPVGATVLLVSFLVIAVYKYGTHNAVADYFGDNMYAELTNIEYEIDELFADFETL